MTWNRNGPFEWRVICGCFLLAALQACGSGGNPPLDAGQGSGGAREGVGGNGTGGATASVADAAPADTITADADAAPDGNGSGTPFICGNTKCVTGQTYCLMRAGPFQGPDGGALPPTYFCSPLDCSTRDCACVVANQGDTYCSRAACEQTDAGQVIAHCGYI